MAEHTQHPTGPREPLAHEDLVRLRRVNARINLAVARHQLALAEMEVLIAELTKKYRLGPDETITLDGWVVRSSRSAEPAEAGLLWAVPTGGE